jgi:hypothetical protein
MAMQPNRLVEAAKMLRDEWSGLISEKREREKAEREQKGRR